MGYNVHITRKTNWFDETGPQISGDEWQNYVASDSEMVISGAAEHTTPEGETIRLTDPLLAEWRCHSSGSTVWFAYFKGSLSVKNPDDECLSKMQQVAAKLQARVQGDDGEPYNNDFPKEPQERPSHKTGLTEWFKSWLRPQRRVDIENEPLPFGVGDTVRDPWGTEHVVISIAPQAEHGMGVIRTRRKDGTELKHLIFAHGLKPVTKG